MASGRRPGKRSIVGSRVCAPLADGLLYPGVIVSIQPTPDASSRSFSQQSYAVCFDADGSTQAFRESDLFGIGFQTVSAARLRPGQAVYITHNGREVKGRVEQRHGQCSGTAVDGRTAADEPWNEFDKSCAWDEVWVSVDGEIRPICRKVEEVRLMESRKSARLQQDSSELHHLQLQYVQPLPSPNIIRSHVSSSMIDVPDSMLRNRRELYSGLYSGLYPGQSEEMMQFDNDYDGDDDKVDDVPMFDYNIDSSEQMDEHMAALVLTSLSCSPASPACVPGGNHVRPIHPSVGSSGLGTSCSPSPPKLLLSQSAPADVNAFMFPHCDIGAADSVSNDQTSKRILFKCTWPGCGREYSTCPAVEKHVRSDHLGPRDDSSVDMSDHEEEFYYTEVEENVDAVRQTSADMQATSPTRTRLTQLSDAGALPDHDYQRKSLPLTIPKSTFSHSHHQEVAGYTVAPREVFSLPSSLPSEHTSSSFVAWPVPRQLPHSFDSQELQSTSNTNHFMLKSASSGHRRSRTDVKKCRKVYGIENRAMWCTQCKWKKACNRFQEHRPDDAV